MKNTIKNVRREFEIDIVIQKKKLIIKILKTKKKRNSILHRNVNCMTYKYVWNIIQIRKGLVAMLVRTYPLDQ